MTEVNIPLLRKAVEWVEFQDALPMIDSEWQQNLWTASPRERSVEITISAELAGMPREQETKAINALEPHCSTAFCVAGYVAQLLDERYTKDNRVDGVHVSEFAARALGIPHTVDIKGVTVPKLFWGGNTAEAIRDFAEELAGEKL